MKQVPNYRLTQDDINEVKKLLRTCQEIQLSNVSFTHYKNSNYDTDVEFRLQKYSELGYKYYWVLEITHEQARRIGTSTVHYMCTDTYYMYDDEPRFDHSTDKQLFQGELKVTAIYPPNFSGSK